MAAPTAPRHVFMAKVGDTKQAIWILTHSSLRTRSSNRLQPPYFSWA